MTFSAIDEHNFLSVLESADERVYIRGRDGKFLGFFQPECMRGDEHTPRRITRDEWLNMTPEDKKGMPLAEFFRKMGIQ